MTDSNKRNLVFFESASMRSLYEEMDSWQQQNQKRLLSLNVQQDGGNFCCIALTNPGEVIICNGSGNTQAGVDHGRVMVLQA
jgi:hypothetical protein